MMMMNAPQPSNSHRFRIGYSLSETVRLSHVMTTDALTRGWIDRLGGSGRVMRFRGAGSLFCTTLATRLRVDP